jgi:hypothetical protein
MLASIPQRHRRIDPRCEPCGNQRGHEAEGDGGGADGEEVAEVCVGGDAGEEVDVLREDVAAGRSGRAATKSLRW